MFFQGQEMLENQSFDSGVNMDWSKTNTYSYIVQFYRDLIGARRDLKGYTPGLEGDQCSVFQTDNVKKLVAFNRWKSADPSQNTVVVAKLRQHHPHQLRAELSGGGQLVCPPQQRLHQLWPGLWQHRQFRRDRQRQPGHGTITIGPYSATDPVANTRRSAATDDYIHERCREHFLAKLLFWVGLGCEHFAGRKSSLGSGSNCTISDQCDDHFHQYFTADGDIFYKLQSPSP